MLSEQSEITPEVMALAQEIEKSNSVMGHAGKAAEKEVKSSKFSGMIEGFFNSIGVVDPCDLVRKDRGKIETERDALQAAVDELNLAKAEDIKERLNGFSKPVSYTHLTLPTKRIV